jgi:ubiquinone/menaquinone biosynthesis C-methylase UbiE
MFFPNYDKGFSEMYRVTKEGGTCVILTWRESEQMKIIEEARRRVVGNIIEHQTQGHVNFFEKENLLIEYAKNAGFKTAEVTQSAQVWWFSVEFFDNFTTNPAVLQLGSDLTEEQMEQYKQEIKNIARERATEKGIKLDVVANILKATK